MSIKKKETNAIICELLLFGNYGSLLEKPRSYKMIPITLHCDKNKKKSIMCNFHNLVQVIKTKQY